MKKNSSQTGAALVVTLGILTLLSILAVTFLTTSRIQRRETQSRHHARRANDRMDTAVYLALRQIEDALDITNASENIVDGTTGRRVAPVNFWFSERYLQDRDLAPEMTGHRFQFRGVMTSPSASREKAGYVNLLTPPVLALVPSALTNGLPLEESNSEPLRSGWSWLDDPLSDISRTPYPARVAFAVFDLSGFIDANYFADGPSTQHAARVFFQQSDVTNGMSFTKIKNKREVLNLQDTIREDDFPFSWLSYDTNPRVVPLAFPSNTVSERLGSAAFAAGTLFSFNVNSVTNLDAWKNSAYSESAEDSPWYNDAAFKSRWLDPMSVYVSAMARSETDPRSRHRMPEGVAIPYSIANAMDADRIPQISTFTAGTEGHQELATRVDYAVEDVPLINKITVFNLYNEEGGARHDLPDGVDFDDYELDPTLSNHYAVAVEYWYPFAPNSPFRNDDGEKLNFAGYVGIYTNESDITTTTNKAWTASLLRDWFRWNYTTSSNTILQTLFTAWGNAYLAETGPIIWTHPLWQDANVQSELWFTTAMTNHPYWPVSGTNGTYDLTETPVWTIFHPATTNLVETNSVWEITEDVPPVTNLITVVSTNLYTLLTRTNTLVRWSPEEGTSHLFIGLFQNTLMHDLPRLVWMDEDGTFLTNEVTGIVSDGINIPFSNTNTLDAFTLNGSNLWMIVSQTGTNGIVSVTTNRVDTFTQREDGGSNVWITVPEEITSEEIVERIPPLPMSDASAAVLDGLLRTLPTNSLSLLYDHLMAKPEDNFDWDNLFRSLSSIPNLMNNLFPSMQEPSLGDLDENERYPFDEDNAHRRTLANGTILQEKTHIHADENYQGVFWTVYPKQTVSFMEITEKREPQSGGGGDTTVSREAITNYYPLGSMRNGKRNTLWIRPVTTVLPDHATLYETDQIVDEALLENDKVRGWTSVTNLYVPDPRRNAWATQWRPFPNGMDWNGENIRTTNITDIAELPFIHTDRPFTAIGELGNIYASYETRTETEQEPGERRYDTIAFATRSGAGLLDLLSLSDSRLPVRGLVQANTPHVCVLETLLAEARAGWTNSEDETEGIISFREKKELRALWAQAYLDALTNGANHAGWRCFADMMPAAITNRLSSSAVQRDPWQGESLHVLHDYDEDVVASLVERVSFRQNIFLLIVAAQSLAPGSTEAHPVILSDRRAAVTVLRDAFTGRWAVTSWRWLSQ